MQWDKLAEKLNAAGTDFIIEPRVRFRGESDGQATMFSSTLGNALEFKAFKMRTDLPRNGHTTFPGPNGHPFAVMGISTDERFITGTNPASGHSDPGTQEELSHSWYACS
jgi:hypothetical protein